MVGGSGGCDRVHSIYCLNIVVQRAHAAGFYSTSPVISVPRTDNINKGGLRQVVTSMEGTGTRFEMELELMNCLASPEYLHYLAQSGYLDDRAFLRFLEYLQYFKQPEYAKFITYPHSLAMLALLINNPAFRKEIAHVSFRDFVHQQQFLHWQFGKRASPTAPPTSPPSPALPEHAAPDQK